MRTLKSILSMAFLLVIMTTSMTAQTNSKVIVVINEAEWCPACKENGERAMKAFNENNKNGSFMFVKNNLTNDETKQISNAVLKKHGLTDAMAEYKGTGVAYFFNAETKELISQVGISKSNEELATAMMSVHKGTKTVSSGDGGCN